MIKMNYLLYIFLLLIGCASQGNPGGGPKDIKAPKLLDVYPQNTSYISEYEKITLTFDEHINPNSIIKSININPEFDVLIRTKKNKIIIKPLIEWPIDKSIEINLNRNMGLKNVNI